jgi:hypothetical protein
VDSINAEKLMPSRKTVNKKKGSEERSNRNAQDKEWCRDNQNPEKPPCTVAPGNQCNTKEKEADETSQNADTGGTNDSYDDTVNLPRYSRSVDRKSEGCRAYQRADDE